MRRTLRISSSAKTDLRDIHRYTLQHWGNVQAVRYLNQLREHYRALAADAHLGRPVEGFPNIYRLPCEQHAAYYLITADAITILAFLHHRMDAPRHLEQRLPQ